MLEFVEYSDVDAVECTVKLEKLTKTICEVVTLSKLKDWLVNLLAKPYNCLTDELRSPLTRTYKPRSHISCKHAC